MPTSRPRPGRNIRYCLPLAVALLAGAGHAADDVSLTGHVKARALAQAFPDNSLLRDTAGSTATEGALDLRLNVGRSHGGWSLDGAWQLVGRYGDLLEIGRDLAALPGAGQPRNDARRALDLHDTLRNERQSYAAHRLDRLVLGYASEQLVLKIGRQALTWGNGLYFTPLDVINPFDPAAIDTEYKAGDDMLYGQWLRSNGDDVEAAVVLRRDPATGSSGERSSALRYNGLRDWGDFSLLAADNRGSPLLGIGLGRSIGGAVWRADIAVEGAGEPTVQAVTNLGYSWRWGGRNVSGVLEYYFNGFGIAGGDYDPEALAAAPELSGRLARGELYGVGRHYLAGGLTIEMTPLTLVSPTLFANVDDVSALLQLVVRHSVANDMEFIAALDLPVGPDGSEYGGLRAPEPGRYLSREAGLFAQLAWYF